MVDRLSFLALYLQLSEGCSFNVVEVKESEVEGGGMGLFACCVSSHGKIITMYMGNVIEEDVNSIYYITNGSIIFDCKPWSKGGVGDS